MHYRDEAMHSYRATIEYDQEKGAYWGYVPALPGCFTEGHSIDEVVTNLQEAITGHLGDLRSVGRPIPEGDAPAQEEPLHVTVTVLA